MTSHHIIVAGAGITGLMSAYALLQAGHRVQLLDPQGLPPRISASWIAGGMLAPYSEIDLMTDMHVQNGLEGIALWRSLIRDIGAVDSFLDTGTLLIAHQEDRHILERFISHLPDNAANPVQARDLESGLSFNHSYFLSQEAALDPHRIMEAMAAYLLQQDAFSFVQDAFDPDSPYDADWVIDCRGMAAGDKNLRGVKGEIAVVENTEFSLGRVVRMMHPRYPLYIIPRAGGLFTVGATQIESAADESVSVRSAMELLSALYSLHPSFGDAKIIDLCAGIRPAYPDNLPRINRDGHVISINGLFRHGYLLSPVLARNMVAMIETAQDMEAA